MDPAFVDEMRSSYELDVPSVIIGSALQEGEPLNDPRVQVALSVLNRHGLIAGATGTGKTRTLQLLAGQLSAAGVPVFAADIKGDLTGLAAPGEANPRITERCTSLAWDFQPRAHPIELLSMTGKLGAQVRATVHSFGPALLGKVLELNATQTSVLTLVFKYCDDNRLPLLDLADLRTTLQFLSSDAGKETRSSYGGMSRSSVDVLLRSLVGLEHEGADDFFGEPEFDVNDLLRVNDAGEGIISVLELSDVLDRPRLFSTFMLWMLAQLWHTLPEIGDPDKPKLCFFFDEAHLLFDGASKGLLEQIERTARLIRSKGVGVFFVTQVPGDVPSSVLSQLGNRVQHALRVFTPEDADSLRKTVKTFPMSSFYKVGESLTSLGTGEALVTVLSPKGVPTALAATRLVPPASSMATLEASELQRLATSGQLYAKYAQAVDHESAHEIISARIAEAQAAASEDSEAFADADAKADAKAEAKAAAREAREAKRAAQQAERERIAAERAQARMMQTVITSGTRLVTSRTGSDLIRGLLGTFFGGKR
jgi:uncharacterized protein